MKEPPPSSLDSLLSLVLQPPPSDDAGRRVPGRGSFARILNGQSPPRCCPPSSVFRRSGPGLARSPFSLGRSPRAGEAEGFQGEGVCRLARCFLAESAYPPHPSAEATPLLVTGFRPRWVRLSGLLAGTVGGSVCWRLRVVPSAACSPLFSCRFFCLASAGCACPPARRCFVFPDADPNVFGSASGCYVTTYVV